MRHAALAACAALAVLLSCSEEVNHLQLSFVVLGGNGQSVSGFNCATGSGDDRQLLTSRAITVTGPGQAEIALSLVVDFIRVGGLPRCRLTDLYNWCQEQPCGPIAEARQCVQFGPEQVRTAGLGPRAVLDELVGDQLVTPDAPDETVIIRVVGTTMTCDEVAAETDLGFVRNSLLGCAYSCPLVPDSVSGEVPIQLDAFQSDCELQVAACADPTFGGNLVMRD